MNKFGYFLAAVSTGGLAAAWYFRRSHDKQPKKKQMPVPTSDSTDVDTGLCGKMANILIGGQFTSALQDAKATKKKAMMLEKRSVQLARQELKNNLVSTRADARELLESVKTPHPCVFFQDLNNVVDEDDDNEEAAQWQLMLQIMGQEMAAAAQS